jgi:subtilase family protein
MNFSTSTIGTAPRLKQGDTRAFRSSRLSDVYTQVLLESQKPIDYIGAPTDEATIGIIDTFRSRDDEPPKHGDEVHAVILRNGFSQRDTSRISSGIEQKTMSALASLLYSEGTEDFSQRLDAYIELTAGQTLSKANGIMKQLSAQPDLSLRTLNQSQGESRLGIYKLLLGAAWNGRNKDGMPLITETGKKMAYACGHEPDSHEFSPWKFHQSLIERVSNVIDNSEYISGLQQDHTTLIEQLRARGVTVVASAGNDNDDFLDTQNIYRHIIPLNFDDDITSVGDKLVVGALDTKGTPDTSDDEIARFSSRYPAVRLLADGVNVPTLEGRTNTGSSFAAPKVTATLEKIRRAHPESTAQELKRMVADQFRATDGYNILG